MYVLKFGLCLPILLIVDPSPQHHTTDAIATATPSAAKVTDSCYPTGAVVLYYICMNYKINVITVKHAHTFLYKIFIFTFFLFKVFYPSPRYTGYKYISRWLCDRVHVPPYLYSISAYANEAILTNRRT